MRNFRKSFAVFAASAVLLSCVSLFSTGVFAGTKTIKYGDVNNDEEVNLKDAVLIQRHIASLQTLTGYALVAADVDNNKSIQMNDVVLIQKYLAKLIDGFPEHEVTEYTGSDVETPSDTDTASDPNTATDTDPSVSDTDTASDPNTATDTDTASNPDTESDTDTISDPDTETATDTSTDYNVVDSEGYVVPVVKP